VLACDDGSTDGTREILSKVSLPGVKVIFMDENVGRGGVIKHLWTLATGDVIVHQDADLEYDPQDYIPMLEPLMPIAPTSVYGSRFKGSIEGMRFLNRIGNLTMTGAARCPVWCERFGPDDLLQDVPARRSSRGCASRRTGLISKPSLRPGSRSAARGSPRCRSAFRDARSKKARRFARSTRCASCAS
jgi:glycosyltransferase involved in cell wall biosynthesis